MTNLVSSSIFLLVSSGFLCADHIPTHGDTVHLDLNPPGQYYNAGFLELSAGCFSLQTFDLAIGGRPGEACPFTDDLNQPANPFHVEMHLLNRDTKQVVTPLSLGLVTPFLNTTVFSGILTLQAGETAYFDIHINDSIMGPGIPDVDTGRWLLAIFPTLFPIPGSTAMTTFPMAYDFSVTEGVATPDVVPPPPVFVGGPVGPDAALINLERVVPEPATIGLTGTSLFGILYLLRRWRRAPDMALSAEWGNS
jgi:hypothetical protein